MSLAVHSLIETATKKHARLAGKRLSPESRAEIFASGAWSDGERYLRALLNRSAEAYTLYGSRSEVLAVYGLAPPETKSFLDGAGILLDRLQIAVVR